MTDHPAVRVDYLFDTDLKIVQSDAFFPFSLDSVLLARFVSVPIRRGRLIDLCTGGGAIPFLLSLRTEGRITGIDIQPEAVRLAKRGAIINHLQQRVDFICGDAKTFPERIGAGSCDVVTCNPPYFKRSQARDVKLNRSLAIARHEILITLADVVQAAAQLLKPGGKFALVHRPERLAEILAQLTAAGLEAKRMRFVHPRIDRPANMVLLEGTRGGRPGLRVLPPIAVYTESGAYTEDVWPKR
ncbi:MAG: tRNA1(Val) (adenine(37)-N6)-methyltransferase [Sporolactobacillus sp.]|nr:tRNA1(Val) (adenine(37)-N6)-methyltransferase [Sporolactobacillus sp.]MCI1881021.1 tRNA1(Val) (adenine(37)-N6)-methyltransferase [Sporolactobacillus sp.]